MGSIEGYGVLVTGGGSGIGEATAARLVAEGARVTICGRTEEKLVAAAERIGGEGPGSVDHLVADVTDEAAVIAALDNLTWRREILRWLVHLPGIVKVK